MIHEYRIYAFKTPDTSIYCELAEQLLIPNRADRFGKLIGFWTADHGDSACVHHIWSFNSLDERQKAREKMAREGAWLKEFMAKALPLIATQEVRFLSPVAALTVPQGRNGYQLHSYQSPVGQQNDLLQNVLHREQEPECQRVAVYTEVSPDPNIVLELIAVPRDALGAEGLSHLINGRAPTEAVPVRVMHSTLLTPTSFSPLQ